MRTGYRPLERAKTTAAPWPEGPGPNCPIRYTIDPDRNRRDNCVRAIQAIRIELAKADGPTTGSAMGAMAGDPVRFSGATNAFSYPGGPRKRYLERALERSLTWLEQWHKENDRLSWFYSTLRIGLRDANYAPKFQAFHADEALLRFLRAPNQVGKSYAAAAEVLFYASGKHPWKEIDAKWVDPLIEKTILVVTGSDKNREGVFKALWALCPIDAIDWISTHYDTRNMWGVRNPCIVFPKTNTKIIFRSSNQDTDSLNSLTADGIWIDEPPKAGTIDEIRRAGLARTAWVIMSFTPIGEEGEDFTWLRDYVEGDAEYRETHGESGVGPRGKWKQHVIGIPDCPWFAPEELESRRDAYREEQTPQRLFGEWEGVTKNRAFTYYKETGTDRSTVDRWLRLVQEDADEWMFAVGIDHGEGAFTQVAVLIAYRMYDPSSTAVIIDEYVSKKKTTSTDDAEGILEMLHRNSLSVEEVTFWVGDINTGGKEVRGEKLNKLLSKAIGELSGEAAPYIRKPNKYPGSVETEERRVNQAFKERRLKIHSRCKVLSRSFRHYVADGSKKDKALKHALDALRYATQVILDRMGCAMVYSRTYAGRSQNDRFGKAMAA